MPNMHFLRLSVVTQDIFLSCADTKIYNKNCLYDYCVHGAADVLFPIVCFSCEYIASRRETKYIAISLGCRPR